ncbi:MAG: hypothetical protein KIS86_06865 [Devosia sp.]|nr:hypothetical protein [Devosia sp.]
MGYGLFLVREPNNPHDPNALAIYGIATVRWLFSQKEKQWHIGYVPAEVAAEIVEELVNVGLPIGVEMYRIEESGEGFFDIKFFILGPPGHGVATRMKARARKT